MAFDEAKRLRALADYQIVDTPPEELFDNLARLTARIFDTPIALIALLDDKRQWFKARYGLTITETPRAYSLCDHAVRADAPLVVDDARDDPRFANNPLVTGDPHIRFYCGVPLRSPSGDGLGALCLIDRVSRTISAQELAALEGLAHQVELELEIRRRLTLLQGALDDAREEQRAKDQLTAMVVHDMRSPLSSIMLLASAIRTGDPATREDIDALLFESEQLRRMLTDTLDVCLYDVGRLHLRRLVCPIQPIARSVANRMRRLARDSGQSIVVDVPDEPLMMNADPELVRRVLENLVGNALQHGPEHATVTIAFRATESGRVLGEIRDRGETIPEEARNDIFRALEQGTIASKHRGYGLGLTFCKLAVHAHEGTIVVKPNEDGAGNCFAFDLPAA